jgi:hypothetical protein
MVRGIAKAGILSDTYVRATEFREMQGGLRFEHAYLVQVPDALGRVIPEIASMRDDFPAL